MICGQRNECIKLQADVRLRSSATTLGKRHSRLLCSARPWRFHVSCEPSRGTTTPRPWGTIRCGFSPSSDCKIWNTGAHEHPSK
eukprot:3415152-Prymnesium_polylepis.1